MNKQWLLVAALCSSPLTFETQGAGVIITQPSQTEAAKSQKICLSCEFLKGTYDTVGGVVAESEYFQVRQDCWVPIPGFLIVFPKRHIDGIDEFTADEQQDFISLLCKLRKSMRKVLDITAVYIIQEEGPNSHFHLWLFPRYDWMDQIGKKIQSVKPIIQWAQKNLENPAGLRAVQESVEKLQKVL